MKATLNTRTKGYQAEEYACLYLQKQGLQLVTKNYHCHYGEVDLIMRDGDEYVFVEVRSKQNNFYGDAAESITPSKQKKIIATAINYLQKQRLLDTVNTRFDIIGIHFSTPGYIEWLKDAFSADYF
jgi:putative endonuclease